ncbi:MAG: O-antigen ligase family protein [Prevotella sp.]|nr:O-antigen ligase family protein [Candidatus Prevotella equi]
MKSNGSLNKEPWKEFYQFIGILFFFTAYGLMFGRNVAGGVWLDFIQELRPYSIIYCTWILNPQFTKRQKKWMLGTMVITLFSWIYYHPQSTQYLETGVQAEFPVLGQLAICTGMSWYLFTEDNQKNKYIALALVLTGMLAPKFKFLGEVICFIYLIFFLNTRLNFKSPKTVWTIVVLMAVVLFVTWERFEVYYVTGFIDENAKMARPETYKTAILILKDYFPLGSGMGSFACNGAWRYYSPIYPEYGLDHIWGLDKDGGFICDAYYPTLAQFGIVGVILFVIFWKRRLKAFNEIEDMRYYRVVFMTFFCLAIEQTADSSWLSGKGMGYCMLLALCLNANKNLVNEDENEDENFDLRSENEKVEVNHVRDDYWQYHKKSIKSE